MTELQPVYRKDYRQPDYWIDRVELRFVLEESGATVDSRLHCRRHPGASADAPLVLDGEELELRKIVLDGQELPEERWSVDNERLTVTAPGESFVLDLQVRNLPQENTSMEGLYQSSGNFCTQCEAEGFRRITYFLDRPDVMARYHVTIEADKEKYPVLLSNGNRLDSGDLEDGRHWVSWEDPFPKPSYLFALVAGNLACQRGQFTTASGRDVALEIWVEPDNIDACDHAIVSLQKSMKWDEDVFGLEYDLDLYMIVAVSDFNMGAMENKGLNIFNTKYVLARPETATDVDFEQIERVVAHEYFHNWTGNRVTCRDWFQLTLKEGLTVFRDQLFSGDMGSPAVNRIRDVRALRTRQFSEDGGPMAHPIRPESYVEMNNFYTATVYVKGAEVIRMYHTMLGVDGFRRGMDLYFQRHDGGAVECDDFLAAMADANDVDLTQFARWYAQAGTPQVEAEGEYDAEAQTYTLSLTQSCRTTPGLDPPLPFHMPVRMGLVGDKGDIHCQHEGHSAAEHLLHLKESSQTFVFQGVAEKPTPSVFRGFSAPIRFKMRRTNEELAFLFGRDSDAFNRWDAGQELSERLLMDIVDTIESERQPVLDKLLIDAIEQVLDSNLDEAMKALAVTLPSEVWLGHQMDVVLVDSIHQASQFASREIAKALQDRWQSIYAQLAGQAYSSDQQAVARRSLKNRALHYLTLLDLPEMTALAKAQFDAADNMTDAQAALACLADIDCPEREEALAAFCDRWQHDRLVMDKWFSIQATTHLPTALDDVRRLMQRADYNPKNPNRVRSLLGAFTSNYAQFHGADGAGYCLIADNVLALDSINAQMAASLVSSFNTWRRFDASRQQLMREQLERIHQAKNLSKDVGEIVSRALADVNESE